MPSWPRSKIYLEHREDLAYGTIKNEICGKERSAFKPTPYASRSLGAFATCGLHGPGGPGGLPLWEAKLLLLEEKQNTKGKPVNKNLTFCMTVS